MNNLQVYKLEKNNNIDIFTKDKNLVISSPYQNKPLFSLGYHYFIGRTRSAMSITDKIESKNDFYYVVNPFELNIPNYEDTLNQLSKVYLKKEIESRDFYKLWEIFFLFDIANESNLEFLVFLVYGEDQAFVLFRDKFYDKESKKDKIYNKYKKGINADVIVSNKASNTENDFVEILIEQIKNILESQNKNGHLVLKVYDTFTTPTLKLLYLITSMYSESYIYKPFFSRPSDSEKYIICKNFINASTSKKLIDNLEKIMKEKKENISDIFLDVELPKEFIDLFKFSNVKLVNQQQILINEIVKYIKDNNYFGDKYHNFRTTQIEATQWWATNFFPPSNNLYKTNRETLTKLLKTTYEKNILEKNKFNL